MVLVAAKIVDDIKVAGEGERAMQFVKKFNEFFNLGTVVSGPGRMRFFGINIVQDEDMKIQTDADDKLSALT